MALIEKSVRPGEIVRKELPFSEVCMHLRVAGERMLVQFQAREFETGTAYTAQLLHDNGSPFSAPILAGEAGFYDGPDGWHFYERAAS